MSAPSSAAAPSAGSRVGSNRGGVGGNRGGVGAAPLMGGSTHRGGAGGRYGGAGAQTRGGNGGGGRGVGGRGGKLLIEYLTVDFDILGLHEILF